MKASTMIDRINALLALPSDKLVGWHRTFVEQTKTYAEANPDADLPGKTMTILMQLESANGLSGVA